MIESTEELIIKLKNITKIENNIIIGNLCKVEKEYRTVQCSMPFGNIATLHKIKVLCNVR